MYVAAYVYPGCRKETVRKLDERTYELIVREPAQGNRANHRARELIAEQCGITNTDVRILTGHRSRKKVFVINSRDNL